MTDDLLAARIAALRVRFVAELVNDRAELRRPDGATLALFHRIAGRAGTFGFPAISDLASRIETLLREQPGTMSTEAAALLPELDRAMAEAIGDYIP